MVSRDAEYRFDTMQYHWVRADGQRVADAERVRGRRSGPRLLKRDLGWNRSGDAERAAPVATLISGGDLRRDMKDFGPSCFHSASTGVGNAKAAPEGGVYVFDII